ncbi:hypothetical protein BH09ACT7_BH09ACT7_23110 [soil metagenome]
MLKSKIAIATAVTVVVAGCSSPGAPTTTTNPAATSAAQAAAHTEAAIDAVPWAQVGPGWTLATWSPVTTLPGDPPPPGEPTYETATTTLYLVDPAGGRYPITTFPAPGDRSNPQLVDWSGDGNRALFDAPYTQPPTALVVDLHTGAQTTVPVRSTPRFTRPHGEALLLTTDFNGPQPATLERVDFTGATQLTYPTEAFGSPFDGWHLSTPDGTRLVLGSTAGLVLMGNDGTVGSIVSVRGLTRCSPLRWWDDVTVLAGCDVGDSDASQLWLVPIVDGVPTALTAPNNHQNGPDYADLTAFRVPAGTFVQAAGACGVVFLTKLNADGTTSPVSVPNTDPDASIRVVGVNGDDLTLQASAACGPGEALVDYNPGANTSTVLLGPSVNGGGVVDVVPFPGQG